MSAGAARCLNIRPVINISIKVPRSPRCPHFCILFCSGRLDTRRGHKYLGVSAKQGILRTNRSLKSNSTVNKSGLNTVIAHVCQDVKLMLLS
jgi:hypothetical protein